jgi:hypothetical protein
MELELSERNALLELIEERRTKEAAAIKAAQKPTPK